MLSLALLLVSAGHNRAVGLDLVIDRREPQTSTGVPDAATLVASVTGQSSTSKS